VCRALAKTTDLKFLRCCSRGVFGR
jgi:hypothetical protein